MRRSGDARRVGGLQVAEIAATVSPAQATQSAIEAETNENTYIPPDLITKSPGVVKLWASVDRSAGTPSLNSPSYNITSVADGAAGVTTITIATDFSTAVYAILCQIIEGGAQRNVNASSLAAGTVVIATTNSADGSAADTEDFTCAALGDQ